MDDVVYYGTVAQFANVWNMFFFVVVRIRFLISSLYYLVLITQMENASVSFFFATIMPSLNL